MRPPRPRHALWLAALALLLLGAAAGVAALEVHPANPRWLTEDGGATALVLTGAHAWSLFQDYDPAPPFEATRYLRGLAGDGHNFTRGWAWEDGWYSPLPFARERGLYRLSPPYRKSYLKRLRQRIRAARRHGLYVSVMLFQGWSVGDHGGRRHPAPWPLHPFNRANTAERVTKQEGDLHIGRAQTQQLEYVAYLARKLCREPNLIWEIANEPDALSLSGRSGTMWQRQILKTLESECDRRLTWVSCPDTLGLSVEQKRQLNDTLVTVGADLVAPCDPKGRYLTDPPFADGRAVVIADSDHFGPPDWEWAWKAFLRGQHPLFMDLTQELPWWQGAPWDPDDAAWRHVRRALGAIQEIAGAVNRVREGRVASGLAAMAPQVNAGGTPGDQQRPASSDWTLFSSDAPCPQSRGHCIPAETNGDEVLAWAEPGQTLEVCSLHPGERYRVRWKRARARGYHGGGRSRPAGATGCLTLPNPASLPAVLHVERLTG
ncbi:MAG: hypothetical protein R3325_09910 [Thermoanaerobaculia bacterium]|nr:hypothetical protein [Thermoanaerobaculia bacterium]